MNTGPKTNIFLAVSGVIAAGLGVVSSGLPFLQPKDASPEKAPSVQAAPADTRDCRDDEKESVTAALRNFGHKAVEECYRFSKEHEAVLASCQVDLIARRINARGTYKWKGGLRKDDQNFVAAYSTDLSGTEMRVNITSRSRDSDSKCEAMDRATR
jgi:hypothetical protein